MCDHKFVPGDKVRISDLDTICSLFEEEEDGRTKVVSKWAGHILTFSYQDDHRVFTEEADTTFHVDIVEKIDYQLPEHLFRID